MKHLHTLLIAVLALALASCGSKRQISSEDYIAQELAAKADSLRRTADNTSCVKRLLDEAYSWKGVAYSYGGHSKKGADCSGFVMEVFRAAAGIDLPRNSAKQSEACDRVKKGDLEPGDLVFFKTSKGGKISHVGIYMGGGLMIHASTHGVMVNDLEEPYYKQHFVHGGAVPKFAEMRRKEKRKK